LEKIFILDESDVEFVKVEQLSGKKKLNNLLKHYCWINDRFDIGKKDTDLLLSAKIARFCSIFLVLYNKQHNSPASIAKHITKFLE